MIVIDIDRDCLLMILVINVAVAVPVSALIPVAVDLLQLIKLILL